jgi:hypothetical protein
MRRTRLESRVEILKLARLLDTDPDRLAYLEAVPSDDLRRFREKATDRLFDADAQALQRVAGASRMLPTQIAASIGQRAFGPLLCARVAGRLDPGRGVELASRLPADFLADVAVELDPRRASDVIVRIPTAQIVDVAAILVERGEYVAMGRFVGHLSDEAIAAALEVIDDLSLLKIVFVLEGKQRLNHVAGLLPEARLPGLVRAAAKGKMWPEALDLLNHLGERRRGRFADVAAEQSDRVLDGLVAAAQEHELWDLVLPVTRAMSPQSRRRFAALASIHDPEVLDSLVASTAQHGLWPELLPVVAELPETAQRHIAAIAAELDPDVIRRALSDASEHELWPAMVGLAARMDEAGQRRLIGLIADDDVVFLDGFLTAAEAQDLWPQVVELARRLPKSELKALGQRARTLGVVDRLGPLAELLPSR